MGLAEAEAGEGRQHLPDPLHDRDRVATTERAGEEPGAGLGHPLDVAERAPLLVGLGIGDAGELGDHLDHLLVEDDHAVGGSQDRPQVGMEVGDVLPALLDLEIGGDHVALDRAGPEQRDVGDDLGEGVDPRLADQLALARRLDLEDPERLGRADHREGVGVVEGHLLLVVEVELDVVDALDLGHRVRHRRLHPDAEHVELEQAEVLDVVLVELAHREPGVGGLHGGPVEQGGIGEQHPAGVHRDVAREPVEPLHEVEEEVEPGVGEAAGGELGEVAQRQPGVACPDVRERLGDRVGLPRRHPERPADVAHGVAHAVGVHHRDAHAALPAVAVEDRLVDLEPARGLHVDVDVGQRVAQRGEEALHQQVVADRVDAGDPDQVVDQAARARAPGRGPHPEVADQVGDVADGEEVGGVAQGPDGLELVVEPLPDPLPRRRAVAATDPGLAPLAQQQVGGPGPVAPLAPGREPQLGQVDRAQAEVVARVEGAPVGERPCRRQQPVALAVGVAESGLAADVLGELGHLLAGLHEALGVAAVEVALVERHQPACGVEDVDGGGVAALRVAHRVGEHRPEPGLPGQREGAGGVHGRARAPHAVLGREPVADHLEQEVLGGEQVAPRRQRGQRQVVAAAGDRLPHRRVRPEQHHHVTPGQVGGEQVGARQRSAPLTGEVDRGDQPADRGPPGRAAAGTTGVGEQGHPVGATALGGQVAVGAAAHGSTPARPGSSGPGRPVRLAVGRAQRQVDAEHRPDPGLLAGPGELDRAVGAVAVGEREGVHLVLGGPLHQRVGVGRAVLEGVSRRDVEVGEGIRHRSRP